MALLVLRLWLGALHGGEDDEQAAKEAIIANIRAGLEAPGRQGAKEAAQEVEHLVTSLTWHLAATLRRFTLFVTYPTPTFTIFLKTLVRPILTNRLT